MTNTDYLNELVCPICQQKVGRSAYLTETFQDKPKVCYLAHLVTHYRHHHITSWNKCWRYNGGYYRQNWFGDYAEEKHKVNERAKRQIIRKGKTVLQELGINTDDFKALAGTGEETLKVASKFLDEKNQQVST